MKAVPGFQPEFVQHVLEDSGIGLYVAYVCRIGDDIKISVNIHIFAFSVRIAVIVGNYSKNISFLFEVGEQVLRAGKGVSKKSFWYSVVSNVFSNFVRFFFYPKKFT